MGSLRADYINQTLFQEGFTPIESIERLESLDSSKQRCLIRCDFYMQRMQAPDFLELINKQDLGSLLYSELVPVWPNMEQIGNMNLTFRRQDGDISYVTLVDETRLGFQLHRTDPLDGWRECRKIIAAFPKPVLQKKPDKEVVEMSFWMSSPTGPMHIGRAIDVMKFAETRGNYSKPVAEALDWTIAYRPEEDARLFLFNGDPGTGKTHAIRSLAWEWKNWARFHYITDPEVFFGNPAYMFQVLSARNNSIRFTESDEPEIPDTDDIDTDPFAHLSLEPSPVDAKLPDGTDKRKWTVLVLEDCGELIVEDAKDRTGQGLSRLLNMVDGLLGQGMKVLVLITTNEPMDRLNQAVMRAGRCAQRLEFLPLTRQESEVWLRDRGVVGSNAEAEALTRGRPVSIADLYAIRRDHAPKVSRKIKPSALGFAS